MGSAYNFLLVAWKRVELAPTGAAASSVDLPVSLPSDTYVASGAFPLPLGPEQIEYQALMASQLRFTASGVDIQRSPQRAWSISIRGSSGLRERTGFDRNGIPMRASGPMMHRELVGFLQEFSRDPTARLSWHDFVKGRQLWVEPRALTDGRDQQHTLDDSWSIQLQGYGESGYPTGGLGLALSLGAQLRDVLAVADRWLSVVAASADLAAAAIAEVVTLEAGVADLFNAVPEAIAATASLISGTAELKDYPLEFWRGLSERLDVALLSFDSAIERWTGDNSENLAAGIATRSAVRELQTQCAVAGLAQASAVTSTPATYTVCQGDTMQSIAAKTLGSSSMWLQIVALNGLMAPYVSSSGMAGTVGPGDTLNLPVESSQVASAVVYGADLMLSDGRLVAEPGTSAADVQYVSGVACALQGLQVLVNTQQGTDPHRLWLGVPAAIGDAVADSGLILASLVDQVLGDDRFVRVQDLSAARIANGVRVGFRAVLRSAQTVPLSAVVGGAA